MSALTGWRPLHEAHAIQVAHISLKFAQPMTDVPWGRTTRIARDVSRKFRLPAENSIQAMNVQFPPGEGAQVIGQPITAGLEFVRFRTPDFFEEKLTLEKDEVRFETWIYTRWRAFADRSLAIMTPLLHEYLGSVALRAISVQYIDRFNATGDAPSDAGEIIDVNSGMIVRQAFRPSEGWHSHAGWFDLPDEHTRRLTNVDVNTATGVIPPQMTPQRFIQIRTAKTDMFNMPGLKPLENDNVSVDFVSERCETLHNELNDALRVVLTEGASDRIALPRRGE